MSIETEITAVDTTVGAEAAAVETKTSTVASEVRAFAGRHQFLLGALTVLTVEGLVHLL